ncbi:MAG TPA: sensor histidine kinase [Methylotenera sp.]|nr:sensor histidine kinase [Methylotenera sp.]HPV44775.1 sensor histidine kinase [Methylotenera sp.]
MSILMFNYVKINQLLAANSQRILALMLLTLHAFLIWGDGASHLQRAFFLCHYGLFLMWQPVWRSTEKLSAPAIAVFVGVGLIAFFYINWWLTAIWLSILFGLLGGRVFAEESKSNHIIHILAASYLLSMLLLWVIPKLLGSSDDLEAAKFVIRYFIPLLPIAILFIGGQSHKAGQVPILDFFYTLLLMMMAFILALSSYAVGTIQAINYVQVMFITIFGLAFGLIIFSFFWKPNTRFSGVELLMSRYLLSIGMPFEKWIKNIAAMGEIESTPNGFIQAAMAEMTALPWVSGVSWLADESQGKLGETSDHITHFNFKDFHMSLHTRWQISPALYVHVKLLTQIMGEFYEAKRREETLRQNAYMQAFYETGSRLTHDIKNILQSVGALVSAAEQSNNADNATDNEALLRLIRRQLPMLNQRIAATLDKLKAPGEDKKRLEKMSAWWKNLQLRHHHDDIEFLAENLPKQEINAEVLDSVLDNLLNNALEKIKHQPDTSIKVEMHDGGDSGFCIDVVDTGRAMNAGIANDLFKKHIASPNGLGVGLYHAAQDARQAGYALSLASNLNGEVRFRIELAPNPAN